MAAMCISRCGTVRRKKNLFHDTKGELGLSPMCLSISSAASCITPIRCVAITNPTVNCYKRINAPRTLVGRHLVAQHA